MLLYIVGSCSLIQNTINTFDDATVDAFAYMQHNNETCLTLMVGDCSEQPKMAVFVTSRPNDKQRSRYGLKVFVGGNFFTFEPQSVDGNEPIYITVNDIDRINIRSQAYKFPVLEKFYDFR